MAASKTTKKTTAPKPAPQAVKQAPAAQKAPAKPTQKAPAKPTKKAPAKPTKKAPAAKKAPPPTPAAGSPSIEAGTIRLTVLEGAGPHDLPGDGDTMVVAPPTFFAVTLTAPLDKRYRYLLQKEEATSFIVLLLVSDRDGGGGDRLPPAGAFQRAIVAGTVHVLGSDEPVNRAELVAAIGGHEPPATPTKPPYT